VREATEVACVLDGRWSTARGSGAGAEVSPLGTVLLCRGVRDSGSHPEAGRRNVLPGPVFRGFSGTAQGRGARMGCNPLTAVEAGSWSSDAFSMGIAT